MVSRLISFPDVVCHNVSRLARSSRLIHTSAISLNKEKSEGPGIVNHRFGAQKQDADHLTTDCPPLAKGKVAKAHGTVDDGHVEWNIPEKAHIKAPYQLRGIKIVMPQANLTVEDHNMVVQNTNIRNAPRYMRFVDLDKLRSSPDFNVLDSSAYRATYSSERFYSPLYGLSDEAEKKIRQYELNRKATAMVEKAALTLLDELKESVEDNKNIKVGDEATPPIIVNFVTRGDLAEAAERNESATARNCDLQKSDFNAPTIVEETCDDPFEALYNRAGLGSGLHSDEYGRAALPNELKITKDNKGWMYLSNNTLSGIKTIRKEKLDSPGNLEQAVGAQKQEADRQTTNGEANDKRAEVQCIVDDGQVEWKVAEEAHIKTPYQLRGIKIAKPQKKPAIDDHTMISQDTNPCNTARNVKFSGSKEQRPGADHHTMNGGAKDKEAEAQFTVDDAQVEKKVAEEVHIKTHVNPYQLKGKKIVMPPRNAVFEDHKMIIQDTKPRNTSRCLRSSDSTEQRPGTDHHTTNGGAQRAEAQFTADAGQVEWKVAEELHIKAQYQLRCKKIAMSKKNPAIEDHTMILQDTNPRNTSKYLRSSEFDKQRSSPGVKVLDSADCNVTDSSGKFDNPLHCISEEAEERFQQYELNRKAAAIVEKAAQTLLEELKESVVGNEDNKTIKVDNEAAPPIVVNFVTRGDLAQAAERNESSKASSCDFQKSDFNTPTIVDETDDPFNVLYGEPGFGSDWQAFEYGGTALKNALQFAAKDDMGWFDSDLSNGIWTDLNTIKENLFKVGETLDDPFEILYKEDDLASNAVCERNPLDNSCKEEHLKVNYVSHPCIASEAKDQTNAIAVGSSPPGYEFSAQAAPEAILEDSKASTSDEEIPFFSEGRVPVSVGVGIKAGEEAIDDN